MKALFRPTNSPWKGTFYAIFVFLNGLTECDDIDHGNRYFDSAYFDTKFKAFRNLGAEWQGWMQVKNS